MLPAQSSNLQQGFVTLMSVIIVGSIGLVLAGLLYTSSIWVIKTSGDDANSAQARKAADACVEIALQSIHDNNSFTGNGTSTLASATCTYLVTNLGGNNRSINATGTISSIFRKNSVSINALSPSINVSNWQEVP